MVLRIENNIVNDKSELLVKASIQQEQVQKIVPVGQTQENKTDDEKPVEGYYIEKTRKIETSNDTADDIPDDEPDTAIHDDAKITIDDIALDESDKISEAIKSAELTGLNSAIGEDYARLQKAYTMAKSDSYSVMDQPFKKGFHGNGIFRYQYTNYSIIFNEDPSEITKTTHTGRIDFSGTYESPKGNTKLMFFGSGATTEKYLKYGESIQEDENLISASSDIDNSEMVDTAIDPVQNQTDETVPTEYNEKISQYHLYFGGKFNLGNDRLYANIMHAKGGDLEQSKLTEINAKYYVDKFNVTFDGNVGFYNAGHLNTTKTNFSCYLGTREDEQFEQEDNSSNLTADESEEAKTEEQTQEDSNIENNSEKRITNDGLIIKTEALDGSEVEQGIGYWRTSKKYDENSFFKTAMFGLVSTTPRKEETSSYHITGGFNLLYEYKKRDLSFDVNFDVKDKVSFCGADKGNTLTTFVDANCKYKRTNAKFEGKYIYTPFSQYFGAALRASHQLNKNIIPFVDVSYLIQNNDLGKTQGVSILAGVNVKF